MFDWKIAIFALQFISTIVTVSVFCIIKFNDLRHLKIDVDEFKEDLKENSKKFDKINDQLTGIEKAIIKQKTLCSERHKK